MTGMLTLQTEGTSHYLDVPEGGQAEFGLCPGVDFQVDWHDRADQVPYNPAWYAARYGRCVHDLIGQACVAVGRVRAFGGFWFISNFSSTRSYVVANAEGAGEFIKILPGRLEAPIPFEISRVTLLSEDPSSAFLVMASAPLWAAPAAVHSQAPRVRLDRSAKYFAVLVAFCERRLRDPACQTIPTINDVARRLRDLGLTHSAVNFHITYLIQKLNLDPDADTRQRRQGTEWRARTLVQHALSFGLVSDEDLVLLPPDQPGRTHRASA
jgi:hypothetical protein